MYGWYWWNCSPSLFKLSFHNYARLIQESLSFLWCSRAYFIVLCCVFYASFFMHPLLTGVCVVYIYPYPYIRPSDLTQSCKSNGPLFFLLLMKCYLTWFYIYLLIRENMLIWHSLVGVTGLYFFLLLKKCYLTWFYNYLFVRGNMLIWQSCRSYGPLFFYCLGNTT